MADSMRSGTSDQPLDLTDRPAWVYQAAAPPNPGFYTPSSSETLGPQKIMTMANTCDYAFAPVLAGNRLYFGSSSEETFFCLDSVTGKELWRFYPQGPIRLSAVAWDNLVLFGCDDGSVYALDAETGALKWKFNAAPEPRQIIANGRPASQWPVRTGITVDENGIAYFSAGLFPASGGVTLYAIDAASGREVWQQPIDLPPQGYILKDGDTLYVPNGRASPAAYSAVDGKPLDPASDLRRQGGGARISLIDDMVVYGPTEFGILRMRAVPDGSSKSYNAARIRIIEGLFTGLSAQQLLYQQDIFYLLRENSLSRLPREAFRKTLETSALEFYTTRKVRSKSGVQMATDPVAEQEIAEYIEWELPLEEARCMILADSYVIVGAHNRLYAFDKVSGKPALDAEVDGTVWELAASEGRLYASTDTGRIYCFGKTAKPSGVIQPEQTSSYSGERMAAARADAKAALEQIDTRKGFALVAGLTDGALAAALAEQSDLYILAVGADADIVRSIRENLSRTGLYGNRIAVRLHSDEKLPYIPYFANLILFEGAEASFAPKQFERLLQPYGGVMIATDGSVTRRGPLEDAGDWTHMFANPANTSCSGDELIGGLKYRIQWFGNPGDLRQVGWHANGMGPLAKDGRLYVVKVNSVEAVDSYNGTQLWQRDVPNSARFSPGREGGSACVDDKHLYLAVQNDCLIFDVETGEQIARFFVPQDDMDWGYIARAGNLLFGTAQKPEATQSTAGYGAGGLKEMWKATEPEFAVSGLLFALDAESGKTRWTYGDGKRVVINSTITIDGDRIYLIESRKPDIVSDDNGSVLLRNAMDSEIYLVALDFSSGKPAWEQPFEFPTRTMLYLSAQNDTLIASGGYHIGPIADAEPSDKATPLIARQLGMSMADVRETRIHFIFQALDTRTGKKQWDAGYTSSGYFGAQHNYNVGHPVITPTDIWHAPGEQYVARIDLKTGQIKEYSNIQRGKGCATPTGSANAMFYRSLAIASFDFESETQFYVSRVNRPSCWMSILPANGLVQMPEYSYGCNCAFPLQTSIVLIPEDR